MDPSTVNPYTAPTTPADPGADPHQHSVIGRRTLLGTALGALAVGTTTAPSARAAVPATQHPRLYFTDRAVWRRQAAIDATTTEIQGRTLLDADALLGTTPSSHTITAGRLLAVSREVLRRVMSLAVAWMLTDDQRYLDRLLAEVDAVLAFPDWNEAGHFLDAAELCLAMALAHDWCHDRLGDTRRAAVEQALVVHALRPGVAFHQGNGVVLPGYPGVKDWPTSTDNWNLVCNGGLVVGALTLADVQPALSAQVVDLALASMPRALVEYSTDGGYAEGPGYWHYATKYLVAAAAALEHVNGTPSPLATHPGVAATGLYPVHMADPVARMYNLDDCMDNLVASAENLWLGARHNLPASMWWGARAATTRAIAWDQSPMSLLWYRAALNRGPVASSLPLDRFFQASGAITARSAWEDPSATFVGASAGTNLVAHSHLDLGSFVLVADQVRWAMDIGMGDYALPGYFAYGPRGERWTYFRTRAESHNTMVFGANPREDQAWDARASVVRTESSSDTAYSVVDLSTVTPNATRWRRGLKLTQGRRQLVVQDEYQLAAPGDAWWFLHTRAQISIAADGRSATLTQDGKQVRAVITSPAGATFVVAPAKPLWTSPDPLQPAEVVRRLAIRRRAVSAETLTVQIGPATSTRVAVTPLDSWALATPTAPAPTPAPPLGPNPSLLNSITVDGVPLAGFSPTRLSYETATTAARPAVRATAASTARIAVQQPTGVPGTARITVAQRRRTTTVYTVTLNRPADVTPMMAANPVGLTTDAPRTLALGASRQVTARLANGVAVPASQVEWVSTNPAVARIDAGGRLVAVAHGTTTIAAVVVGTGRVMDWARTTLTV